LTARPAYTRDAMGGLSLLMPVFNEARTLERAIQRVLATDFPLDSVELIVIDDGSRDGSAELLERLKLPDTVTVLHHPTNRGKGAAVRTGLARAGGTYTAVIDADLEYDPRDTAKLLSPLLDRKADAVFGVRGFEAHSAHSFWYVIGNKTVSLTANVLFNSWISDLMTCHKMVRTDLFRALPLRESGFAIEPEITARLVQAGARIYEVPVTYNARGHEDGKKLQAVDGMRVLKTLIRCRLTGSPNAKNARTRVAVEEGKPPEVEFARSASREREASRVGA
jgi:dolichol-phosphate hexosyltransferase